MPLDCGRRGIELGPGVAIDADQQQGPSLRARAALAAILTIGFYSLAISLGVALIAGPFLIRMAGGPFNIWVALAMIGAGVTIFRALIPERENFEPPGPELTAQGQPELHGLLAQVAESAGEPMPGSVYFDPTLNAAVTEVSAGLGHGRRRVMLIGLPLLSILNPDELRAVIAHEFGHYVGGDTRFGTWIWRTRSAIFKTIASLNKEDSLFQRVIVRGPFLLYGRLFLRITNAVSRRQEFAADSLSARLTSPEAAGSALRRITACAPAFDAYWREDVAPALQRGHRPPVAQGFQLFVGVKHIEAQLEELVSLDIQQAETNPYDSHPTLAERLRALGVEQTGAVEAPGNPAVTLARSVDEIESGMLVASFGAEARKLTRIEWDEVGRLRRQDADELAAQLKEVLGDVRLADLGALAADLSTRRDGIRAVADPERRGTDEQLDGYQLYALSALSAGALARSGWQLAALPGEPVKVTDGESELVPGELLRLIAVGEAKASDWEARIRELGVAELMLIPDARLVAPPPAAATASGSRAGTAADG